MPPRESEHNAGDTDAKALAESRAADHELIVAAQAGDQDAFGKLMLKYQERVQNHCVRIVGDEQEAEDLKQEVFVKVYRSLNNYQHTYGFYTWMYRITQNCCIDRIRKIKRQAQEVSLTPGLDEDGSESPRDHNIPDETHVPEKEALNNELKRTIDDALAKLSPKLREIIVLKEQEGLSYEEIGAMLHCSRGTVKSRLFRARDKLQDLLASYVQS